MVSGEPPLIFGDILGFLHGINFLVLAIGIYGIGEMLWTIESSRGEFKVSQAKVSLQRVMESLRSLKNSAKQCSWAPCSATSSAFCRPPARHRAR